MVARAVIGVALEGCSVRAAFHVGVVEWFVERGLPIGVVGGASSGSLVAVAVAAGRVSDLREAWSELLGKTQVFQPRRLLSGRWPMAMSDILAEALETWVGDVPLTELTPIAIPVTHLERGFPVVRVLTHCDAIPASVAIRASSFLPGPYDRMVRIDGRWTVDGAWLQRTPVAPVRELGASKVIAVVSEERGRLIGGLFRRREHRPAADTRVLSPARPLPIRGFSFDRTATEVSFRIGRDAAEMFAREHEAWLA